MDTTEIAEDKAEADEEGKFTEEEELRSSEDDNQAKLKQIQNQIKQIMRDIGRCVKIKGCKFFGQQKSCINSCKSKYDFKRLQELQKLRKEKKNLLPQWHARLSAYRKVINEMEDAKKKKCIRQVKKKVEESLTTQLLSKEEKDAFKDEKVKANMEKEMEFRWRKLGGNKIWKICYPEE